MTVGNSDECSDAQVYIVIRIVGRVLLLVVKMVSGDWYMSIGFASECCGRL